MIDLASRHNHHCFQLTTFEASFSLETLQRELTGTHSLGLGCFKESINERPRPNGGFHA
jgi:hypothetical protein